MSLLAYDPGLQEALAGGPQLQLTPLKELQPVVEAMMADADRVMANQRQAYERLSEASIMPVQTIGQPPFRPLPAGADAQVCVKTGYLAGDEFFVSKVAGGGGAYAGNTGMLLLFSQKTLKLERLLLDEGVLTEIRTAAGSAFASELLMPPGPVTSLGLFGCGIQAIWQLRFLHTLFAKRRQPLPAVQLRTRSPKSAAAFIAKMKGSACALDRDWSIAPMTDSRQCQLIHTVTANRGEPLLTLADVHPNAHITAVGADSPGKRELSLDLVGAAALCLTDSLTQTVERGEYQHYIRAHGLDEAGVRAKFEEIGAYSRSSPSRARPEGITIFDTSGVAVQDVSIATLAVQMMAQGSAAYRSSNL